MKSLRYIGTALLSLLLAQPLSAQTSSYMVAEYGNPLITDAAQISSNASDRDEGQDLGNLIDDNADTYWHSDWHKEVTAPHYLQFELIDPVTDGYLVLYLQRRNHSNDHLKRAVLSASEDAVNWVELAELEFPNAKAGAEVVVGPIKIEEPYFYFRLTNKPLSGESIFFHAAEVELYNPSNEMLSKAILNDLLTQYDYYYYDEEDIEMNMGTGYGQHTDYASLALFKEALGEIIAIIEGTPGHPYPSLEEAQAMKAEIDGLFAKIMASKVRYKLPADGYYRILSNLPYYYDEELGMGDDGTPITERHYVQKAMLATLEKRVEWGTLQNQANYIWHLTQVGDAIDMVNAGMDARISSAGGESSGIWVSEASEKQVMFDWAGNENDHDVFYIRLADEEEDADHYFHQYGHNQGKNSDENKKLVTWRGTFDMGATYSSDKGSSEWYLELVPDEEAISLIDAFAPIKDHDVLISKNQQLRTEAYRLIAIAKDYAKEPLIVSAEQMSSPFSQNASGNIDGGDLEDGVLIDNDPKTFWHSIWANGNAEAGSHYIQLSGMDDLSGDICIYVVRRDASNDHPTEFVLKGSNDSSAPDDQWTEVARVAMGNASSKATYTSEAIHVGDISYRYIRIAATKTTSNRGYWHSAELQIYSLQENPNSMFAAMGDIATALENEYNRNLSIADDDLTIDDYNALQAAFKAFQSRMADPTALREALSTYDDFGSFWAEGDEPGYWEDKDALEAFQQIYDDAKGYEQAGNYNAEQNRIYTQAIKSAARNVYAAANSLDTDAWYSIKFPSKDLYDENQWSTSGPENSDLGVALYDTYVTVAKTIEVGDSLTGIAELPLADIREGASLHFLKPESLVNDDETYFRFIPVVSAAALTQDWKDLLAKAHAALDMTTVYAYGDELITEASQLSSNASDKNEGFDMNYLIDGNPATFWHSDYHEKNIPGHYLQVALKEPLTGLVQLTVTRRQSNGSGSIESMFVTASKNGSDWSDVGYVDLPYKQDGETVTSLPIALDDSYSYLRFTIVKRSGVKQEFDADVAYADEYFHAAEFQLRPVSATTTYTAAGEALRQALTVADRQSRKAVTADDYAALLAAYEPYRAEVNDGDLPAAEAAKAVPGRAYVMQNKATGLFVHCQGANNNHVTLELMPTLYDYRAIGFGEGLLHGVNLDGTDCSNLHAQRWNQRLVTWNADEPGSNSGLMLEYAESVTATDFTFTKDARQGALEGWCYPVALTVEGDGSAYTVAGTFAQGDDIFLGLKATKEIAAAQPVFYLYGTTDSWSADDEQHHAVPFRVGSDICLEAQSENGLQGCLAATDMTTADLYAADNELVCADESTTTMHENGVVLHLDACPEISADGGYDIAIVITEAAQLAQGIEPIVIEEALRQVSVRGTVYTLDGRRLMDDATLDDVKALGQGLYLLNGVKILVR